jgi:hypothetical protein
MLQRSALHLLYEGFVTPIANKFIVPPPLAFVFWRAPSATMADATDSGRGAPAVRARRAPTSRARSSRRRRRR